MKKVIALGLIVVLAFVGFALVRNTHTMDATGMQGMDMGKSP